MSEREKLARLMQAAAIRYCRDHPEAFANMVLPFDEMAAHSRAMLLAAALAALEAGYSPPAPPGG